MGDPLLKRTGDGPTPFGRVLGSARRQVSPPRLFPGVRGEQGLKYCLRALSNDEILQARSSALRFLQKFFAALDKDTPVEAYLAADPNFFDDEFEVQILAVAMRDPGNPESPFANAGELRIGLVPDERSCLMASYNDWLDESSPLRKVRTQEELNELVAVLGKDPGASAWLASCDTVTLRRTARELAAELMRLQKQS